MHKMYCIGWIFVLLVLSQQASAQKKNLDDLLKDPDTQLMIDSLMSGFDDYLDSILQHQNHFHASLGIGSGQFSFESKATNQYVNQSKLVYSPAVGFTHRSGFGLNAVGFMIMDNNRVNPYMLAVMPSYDFIKRKISAGVSFSKYFVKDSLSFYTTPISQELYAYFTYKEWPVRPSVAISYGWGSESSFNRSKIQVRKNRKKSGSIYVNELSEENVSDLSMLFSLRRDFNFFDLVSTRDMLSLTPVILLRAGTQRFGFNATYSYETTKSIKVNSLPTNNSISDRSKFQAESAAMILRASYLRGNWILQPQVLFDYYLPKADNPFNMAWSVTAGWSF